MNAEVLHVPSSVFKNLTNFNCMKIVTVHTVISIKKKAKQLLLAAKIPAACNILLRPKINMEKWTQQKQITCVSDLDLLCKLFFCYF